jgi:hypothetical protein
MGFTIVNGGNLALAEYGQSDRVRRRYYNPLVARLSSNNNFIGRLAAYGSNEGARCRGEYNDLTNRWDQLLGGTPSNLWSLMAGNNQVNIAMSGSTANTSVGLSWVNRWNRA